MANLIIESSPTIKWYSDLWPFFSLIESSIRRHRWLWTDVETASEMPVSENDFGRYLVNGDTLFDFTATRPQFIWSVLTALPADTDFDPLSLESVPSANGNSSLWHGSPKPQFNGARFEIVCWDSAATLLVGADDSTAGAFRTAYPGARDLDAANQSRV